METARARPWGGEVGSEEAIVNKRWQTTEDEVGEGGQAGNHGPACTTAHNLGFIQEEIITIQLGSDKT